MSTYKNSTFEEIELDKIMIDQIQVRTQTFGDIQELADNIRAHGLLQPIRVTPRKDDGRYEIILGQRRYLAYKNLQQIDAEKFSKIPCFIDDRDLDNVDYKILSISENFFREPNSDAEKIDAFEAAFNKYADLNTVAQKMGCKTSTARKYIRVSRLPEEMVEAITNKEINADDALKSHDKIAGVKGIDNVLKDPNDIEMALELGRQMKGTGAAIKKNLINKLPDTGDITDIDDLTSKIKSIKNPEGLSITVNFAKVVYSGLENASDSLGKTKEDIVHDYTVDSLTQDDFIEEE